MNKRIALAISLVACLVAPAAPASPGVPEKNKALTRRVFDEILNKGKYELFDEIYTANSSSTWTAATAPWRRSGRTPGRCEWRPPISS